MIIKNKNFQIIGLTVALVLFFMVGWASFRIESNTFIGVKLISNDEYEKISYGKTDDFDVDFLFNNEPAAVDKTNNVIYISQNVTEKTQIADIVGVLSTVNPNYQLMIKKDNNFDSIPDTVSAGNSYSLLALDSSGNCTEYRIVFTALPVINITGDISGIANNGTDLYTGTISFFDPDSPETESYRAVASDVQWHIRGNTTARQPKKPWKLSLKDHNGNNKNMSFCGLGSDDDWILNPMNLDDIKIREKLMMDLWNMNELLVNQGLHMSQGEYVEVVLNGEYYGLYLLQRKLDKKYLNVSDNDILIKSKNMATKTYVSSETVEIVYSPFTEQETYSYLKANFDDKYIQFSNIENWTEMTVYTQMCCAIDNVQSKNIIMLLKSDENNDYTVNYILWDTDMSFGLFWSGGYVYDYDKTVFLDAVRFEYPQLSDIYPDLDRNISHRWTELRKTIFSDQSIHQSIDSLYHTITHSCSLQRDIQKWGLYYKGADNMDQLYTFIENRMEYLDNYYAGI